MAKAGLVAGGYAAALAAACLVTALYVALTSGPDRDAYGAMYGFGDMVLFFAAFCVAALPATALWLYFLRVVPRFWSALSALGWGASGLSLLLLGCELLRGPALALLLAPLWFLASPLFICGFGMAFLFAPSRPARRVLGGAALIAGGSVGLLYVCAVLLHP
jgi:hypothetical protein